MRARGAARNSRTRKTKTKNYAREHMRASIVRTCGDDDDNNDDDCDYDDRRVAAVTVEAMNALFIQTLLVAKYLLTSTLCDSRERYRGDTD